MADAKTGGEDKTKLHLEIMKKADQAVTADWDNRVQMLDDLRFASNELGVGQWDPIVLRERMEQGRPIITINLIPQFVRQVTNDARNNRPAIKVRPVDDDADVDTADVLEGIVRHIEDQSEADSKAYIPAIDNAAKCGIGTFRVVADYCDDMSWDQDLYIKGIPNALAVLWDPASRDPVKADANYVFVVEDISKDDFEAKYPEAVSSNFDVAVHGNLDWNITDATVRIAEYWCKEPCNRTLAKTQDGKILDITDVPKSALQFLPPHKTKKVKSHKIVQYIVSGSEILEGPTEWKGKYIPIIPVIGEETWCGENRVRSGLVRHAKDPQRLYNLWRSNQCEVIGLQPKAPILATFKQIEKYRAIWNQANKRNIPYLPYDPDGSAPVPQRLTPPQPSTAMAEEIAVAANELRSTTGIYDAGLGQHTAEAQSGKAIGALQKQSDIATLHFGDNLQLAIRQCGRILIDLIPYYYDTEKTVRLLNEDGTNEFEKINSYIMTQNGAEPIHDLSVGTYDVTVTTGPSYATRRMEASDAMLQFIQTAPEAAQFVMDIIAKNQDWPGAEEIAKRFRTELLKTHPELRDPQKDGPPPPPSPADQANAIAQGQQLQQGQAQTRLLEAQADDAEMDAAVKAVTLDATASTHHVQVESAILKELMDVISRGQAALNPEQPGQGQSAQMPQPSAPAGA